MTQRIRFQEVSRQWYESLGFLNARGPLPDFDIIAEKYNEPHRKYHTLDHIYFVLYNLSRDLQSSPVLKLMAILHDVEYVIKPVYQSNEESSADFADALLRPLLAGYLCSEIRGGIISTREGIEPRSYNEAMLHNADYEILAAHPSDYDAYVERVKEEYSAEYNAIEIAAGRLAFIEAQLKKPRLFYLGVDDTPARENLQRELDTLLG